MLFYFKKNIMNVKEAVDNGIKFLDFFCHGWRDKIDVDRLNMRISEDCIIGQLYNEYNLNPLDNSHCYYYGFDVENFRDYNALEEEWKSRLKTRFNLINEIAEPGEYVVLETEDNNFVVGDIVVVLNHKDENLGIFNSCNFVAKNLMLFNNPHIVVTPKK
jgi:hypothetical protein